MHIGFLTPEYVIPPDRIDGGLANYLRKIAHALSARGHKVSIIVISDKYAQWQDGEVTVHEIKRFSFGRGAYICKYFTPILLTIGQILSSRRVAKKVWKVNRNTPFDILQTSNDHAPGLTLVHNKKIPVVCRVSSYKPLWRAAFGRKRSFSEYLSDWLDMYQITESDDAFSPCNLTANIIARYEGVQLKVIYTPVDLPLNTVFDDALYQRELMGKSYLLYFGTLNRIKGVDLLVDVIPHIFSRYENVCLVFIGRDDGLPNGERVFSYICSHNQQYKDRLYYYTALPKSQLYPVIASAIGVLMPSRVDNYPNACLEALSLGVPVIGTYESSLDEIIIDGKTGFLAQNNSPSSLKCAIERLLNLTPTERIKMKENINNYIQEIRTEDRVAELINFYINTISTFHLQERV